MARHISVLGCGCGEAAYTRCERGAGVVAGKGGGAGGAGACVGSGRLRGGVMDGSGTVGAGATAHGLAKLSPLRWSRMRNGVRSRTIRRVIMGLRGIVRYTFGGRIN